MSNSILGAFSPIKEVQEVKEEANVVLEEAEYVEDMTVTSPMIITSAPGSAKENRRVFEATTPINPRKIARISPRRSTHQLQTETKAQPIETIESKAPTDTDRDTDRVASTNSAATMIDGGMIRSIVREELEELKEVVQRDIRNLHVDLLKGNTILERSIERSLARHLPTVGDLLKEIEELRNENKRLRLRLGL